jgi:FKBP-type peptidyl-prolyl cis-trans isomerase 2
MSVEIPSPILKANQIIRGVESAVEGMEVGQAKQAVVPPTQGYGDPDPGAFHEVPKEKLPQEIQVGTQLHGKDASGREIRPIVSAIKDDTVLLDFNHPLAGKTLYFDLKVVNIS